MQAAEPLRQNEVKVQYLKSVLWEKTVAWVKERPQYHTPDIPKQCVKAKASTGSSKKKKWDPDALWEAIAESRPGLDEFQVGCHHFVEEKMIPWFRDKKKEDEEVNPIPLVFTPEMKTWNSDNQEPS